MEPGWILVYSVDQSFKAEMVKNLLEDKGIAAVVFNKRDSAYLSFGSFEIYVKEEHAEQAREITVNSQI